MRFLNLFEAFYCRVINVSITINNTRYVRKFQSFVPRDYTCYFLRVQTRTETVLLLYVK